MKYFIYFSLILCLVAACKDDDPVVPDITIEDKIKCTLNGSVFSNQFISFNDFQETQTHAGYIDSIDASEIKALAQFNNSSVSFWLRFPGKIVSSYTYNEALPPTFDYPTDSKYFELKIGNDTLLGGIAIQQINLNVSQYDTIGGRIKGTFSGKVYDYTTGSEQLVDINNGQFDIKRAF